MDRKATGYGVGFRRLSGWSGFGRGLSALAAGVVIAVTAATAGLSAAPAMAGSSLLSGSLVAGAMDRLIMRNGNIIQGEILEETETTIRMRVVVAGITSVTTYQKADIATIERAERSETPEAETPRTPAEPRRPGRNEDTRRPSRAADENAAKIYHVRMHGNFGENFSETVVERLIRDIDSTFNDKVDVMIGGRPARVVDEAVRDRHIVVFELDFGTSPLIPGWSQVSRAEQISPAIEDEIAAGRRVVFWVRRAFQGAAFLPWISQEIYFRSGAWMGGIGGLEDMGGQADEEVREKWIGAMLGHAEGRVIKGGRPEFVPVIRAMLRMDFWLAVRFEGGRPIFLNTEPRPQDGPGWTILSDDGMGPNKDPDDALFEDRNDILNLNEDWAMKLGISRGTVNTLSDLARALGVGENYVILEDARGQRIYNDWGAEVDRAWRLAKWTPRRFQGDRPIGELFEDLARVEGNDVRALGQRIQILERVISILGRYSEFMDRDGQGRASLRNQVEQMRLQIQLMRRGGR